MVRNNIPLAWDGKHLYSLLAIIDEISEASLDEIIVAYKSNIPNELLDSSNSPIICDDTGNCITNIERLTIAPAWRLLGYTLDSRPLIYKGLILTPAIMRNKIVSYSAIPDLEYSALFQPTGTSELIWDLPVNYQLRRSIGEKKIISGESKILLKDAVKKYYSDIKKLGFID